MNKSAGRSAFIGKTSSAPHGANTKMSLVAGDRPPAPVPVPETENFPPLPTGEDAMEGGRPPPALLDGDGAELTLKWDDGGAPKPPPPEDDGCTPETLE